VDNLNFLMEYLALGHTFMDPQVVRDQSMDLTADLDEDLTIDLATVFVADFAADLTLDLITGLTTDLTTNVCRLACRQTQFYDTMRCPIDQIQYTIANGVFDLRTRRFHPSTVKHYDSNLQLRDCDLRWPTLVCFDVVVSPYLLL
jgi:hypothetical protein